MEQTFTDRTYWSVCCPVRAADDTVYALGAIYIDITALKEIERALTAVREELEQRAQELGDQNARLREIDELKSDLVGSVSHELRTPLTSIRGYAEMLLDSGQGRLTERDVAMLEVIDRNGQRLLSLIDDLLILSHLDSGGPAPNPTLLSPREIADAAVDVVLPQTLRGGVELILNTAPDLAQIRGERDQLERVVINLLSNAVKFTPAGGRITVTLSAQHDGVRLQVEDTGSGIPADDVPHIFDRFFRSSAAAVAGVQGTGLGLSVVRGIVERHGGRVEVWSEVAVGTSVTVWLPCAGGGDASDDVEDLVDRQRLGDDVRDRGDVQGATHLGRVR
jgi:signal transduction histidine kinase